MKRIRAVGRPLPLVGRAIAFDFKDVVFGCAPPLPPGGEGVGGWGDVSASALYLNDSERGAPHPNPSPQGEEGLLVTLFGRYEIAFGGR
jgi:hypothetical protein